MPSPVAYWIPQTARIGVFLAQYLLSARLSRPVVRRRSSPMAESTAARPPRARRRSPTLGVLLEDLRRLLLRDWRNVRDGLYRLPHDLLADPRTMLRNALQYFDDLPDVNARRRRDAFFEVRGEPAAHGRRFPEYYLRNFHYQSGGYLSDHSARLYDHQVEVLFLGGADAMRRQGLVPIGSWLRRNRRRLAGRVPRLLDLGCGTGRFLAAVRNNFPAVEFLGLDLSRAYLDEAERLFGGSERSPADQPGAALIEGLAEKLPLADGSLDLITAIYLLHEVPGDVRAAIARECARVLQPGGRLIIVDSLQIGDVPNYDGLLTTFPDGFHEPYYADYAASDIAQLMADHGLRHAASERAFLSKVMVFDKA